MFRLANIGVDLDHVAHGLYPRESHLTFNPVRDDWFALAITDEVMLHTTLLAAAIHISTSRGLKTFIEHDLLTERVLRQLNQRLTSRSELTDPTLGAVACLAMLEVRLHVTGDGLFQLIMT